jgi:hypothetical protein
MNSDPTFAKASAERRRKLNSDPAFAKASAERLRKCNASSEFQARRLAGLQQYYVARRAVKEKRETEDV